MKIFRDAYCSTVERYELNVNDAYIAELNKALAQSIVGTVPVVTVDTVKKVMDCAFEDEENVSVEVKSWRYDTEGHTYKSYLFEMLEDWINEDLWDSFMDTMDSQTNDYETWFED